MKKYLITGIGRFLAHHFLERLNGFGEKAEVLGLDLKISKEVKEYKGGGGRYS